MTGFFVSYCLALSLASGPSVERLGPTPKAPVQRIASLAPSLTQAVLFLGAKDKLVAISRFDEEASLLHLPKAGGFSDVATETLLQLRPELVLAQKAPGNETAIRLLAAKGIPILAFSLTTMEDVCQAMALLGELLQAQDKAQAWLSAFEALRQQLKASPPPKRPRVLVLIGLSPLIAAGPGSFVDELLREAGGQNILPRSPSPYPVVSPETVLRYKPDMVINLAEIHEGQSQLQKLPGLREARWIDAPNKHLLQPGPALLPVLRELASWFRNTNVILPATEHAF
ncbi:MAG: helical backbone metal receptor [Cystobacterineae bacterium]|nr:helical backbone metal receptor [Cystobacterineae bacterium]